MPLNENFQQLDRDVLRDRGAIYSADGSAKALVEYATRAVGHYVSYADGLVDEPVNDVLLGEGAPRRLHGRHARDDLRAVLFRIF